MTKHISVIIVILISLISTSLFSQSSEINEFKGPNNHDFMSMQSDSTSKSGPLFSIGGGYAGFSSTKNRPNGFNVQIDIIHPVATFLAINVAFDVVHYLTSYENKESITSNGTIYTTYYNYGDANYLIFFPGLSFGNLNRDSKFNYFITAGFSIGIGFFGETIYLLSSNSPYSNKIQESAGLLKGIFASGRVSYKLSPQIQIFVEPNIYTIGSEDSNFNYHINGGISLNL